MRIIVTGATGFIGRNLAETLHDEGHDVLATGRNIETGKELMQKDIEFRQIDLRNLNCVARDMRPADCIIHCAARTGDWGRPADFHDVNVTGSRNVATACLKHGIQRMIFISTPSVYYNGRDRLDVTESSPLAENRLSPYGRTKLAAERELATMAREGFEMIILRPRAVYGPHDTTIIPRILQMASTGFIPLIGNGRALTDITYIDNLSDVVLACLADSGLAWSRTYNITNGEPISIHDWFKTVLATFDRPFRPKPVPVRLAEFLAVVMETASRLPFGPQEPVMTRFSVGYMARSLTLNIAAAREHLAYEPRRSNLEGFERYAQWYSRYSDGTG